MKEGVREKKIVRLSVGLKKRRRIAERTHRQKSRRGNNGTRRERKR